MKLLIYCTKGKPYLLAQRDFSYELKYENEYKDIALNGYIVAECDVECIEKWQWNGWWDCYAKNEDMGILTIEDQLTKSCLTNRDLIRYGKYEPLYGLHLSNIEPFKEKYKIEDCWQYRCYNTRMKCAPQNMCQVYGKNGEPYILISINPEWVCKILNGEKTIEVRKSILNSMKLFLQRRYLK